MSILSTFRLVYLIGAVNAGFFSCLIFSKKSRTIADNILGIWLIVLFAQLFIPFLYLANLDIYYKYAGYEIVFYTFHPFLLYLYVKSTIGRLPNKKVIIWNTVIIIISEISALSFFIFPAKERLLFIEGKELLPIIYLPIIIIMILYFLYNIYLSYTVLKDYKNNVLQVYSYRENIDLLWLRRLVVLFAAISFLVFPLGFYSYYVLHSLVYADYFFFITLVIFIFFLGYWGYQQGQIFNFNYNDENTEVTIIPEPAIIEVNNTVNKQFKKESKLLQEVMKVKKPYLEPTLTIHDLASLIEIPSHQLSKVINKEFSCNFFEFINKYRIEDFKQKAFLPEYQNMTILGIALNCGFNSKSAFNRIFKDITGLTPGDFIKKHRP